MKANYRLGMVKFRALIVALLVTFCSANVCAQDWDLTIELWGYAPACSAGLTGEMTATFMGESFSNGTPDGVIITKVITDPAGITNQFLYIDANWGCCPPPPDMTGCWTLGSTGYSDQITISGSCSFEDLNYSTDPNFIVGGRVTLYRRPIPQPTLTQATSCSSASVTLTVPSNSSGSFQWQVSENGTTWHNFGSYADVATPTANDLFIPGFAAKYATRYVRVYDPGCGRESGSTAVDFYAPPPTATFSPTDPNCNNGTNGVYRVHVATGDASVGSFLVSSYTADPAGPGPPLAFDQDPPQDGVTRTVSGLSGGVTYWFRVQNNDNVSTKGSCYTDYSRSLTNPSPVTVGLTKYVYPAHGANLKCASDTTGKLSASPSGGSGSYTSYSWGGANPVATINAIGRGAYGLNGNSLYSVTVTDSKGCSGSATLASTLSSPAPVTASLASTGGRGSYGISCPGKTDGAITNTVAGGAGGYTYVWDHGPATKDLSVLAAGTYAVTVTDAYGCKTAKQSIALGPPPAWSFNFTTDAIECAGDNTGGLTVATTGGTPVGALTYVWTDATSLNSPSRPALYSGTYEVTVTDQQLCSETKSTTLNDPPGYSVQIVPVVTHNGGRVISCFGESDGKLSAVVTDALGDPATPANYIWQRNGGSLASGPSANAVNNVDAASYTVTIEYGTGCDATHTFLLADTPLLTGSISFSSIDDHNGEHISCPGASDGELLAAGADGTPGYTFLWNDGTTTATLSGKSAGTYTVTITDANDCEAEATATLIDPDPIDPSVSINLVQHNGLHVSCRNASDGTLYANNGGGTGTLSYLWSRGATDIGSSLTGVAPGSYTVKITDANGCEETSDAFIVVNPQAVVAAVSIESDHFGKHISCTGLSDGWLKASGTGGTQNFTYLWDDGTTTADLTNKPAGTYAVTVRDQNNCPSVANATLVDPEPVNATITTSSDFFSFGVKCTGGNEGFAEVSAEGGTEIFTYLWSNSETTARASGLVAGNYTVVVRDQNGCSDTKMHTITEPAVLSVSLSDVVHVECHDGATGSFANNGSGGVPGVYEYSLNNGTWTTLDHFDGLVAEILYTVRVRDQNECIASVTQTLTQPPQINIAFTTEPAFCADPRGVAEAVVTGGVGAFDYQWTDMNGVPVGNTATIATMPAGIYTLLVHDDNDCPWAEDVGIVTTDGPQVHIDEINTASCSYTADGSATLSVTEGDAPFTFLWPDGQTSNVGASLAGDTYLVVVRDVNDCPTVATVEIPEPDPLNIEVSETIRPNCNGDCNGEIEVTTTGGNGSYTYAWLTQTGATATGLCAGDHSVTVTDAKNCTSQETFTLTQPDVLEVDLVSRTLPLCYGACDGQIVVAPSGGNGGYQYTWSSGGAAATATAICTGDHTVTVRDEKNCTVQGTYNLGQPPLLQVQLVRNLAPICHDGCNGLIETTAVGGTGNYHYTWSNGGSERTIQQICSDEYTVLVKDDHACEASANYVVGNPPALEIDLGGSVTLCVGQTHMLTAGNSWATYAWGSNVGFSAATPAVTVADPGQYWLEVHNAQGCVAMDTFLLETSVDLLQANMIITSEAVVGDTIVIVDVSWPMPDGITWEYPTAMQVVNNYGDVLHGKFNEPGLYQVRLMATLGECFDEMSKTISILRGDDEEGDGRLGFESFVNVFEIYPNPTDGSFNVNVEIDKESPVTLSVWSGVTGNLIRQMRDDGKKQYIMYMDLRPMTSGPYLLRLDHAEGHQLLRFIVH